MATISLCMIVKNEEEVLHRCLSSICDLVDEIIIVDTGSEDKTCEIAEKFTDKIYHFQWIDDFAQARNYSFSLATKEFCMWLDADDVMEEMDRKHFREEKETLKETTQMVMMKYHAAFDACGNSTFTYYRERMIRNHTDMKWQGAVHEAISPIGEVVYWKSAVSHKKMGTSDPNRNLRILENLQKSGRLSDVRLQFYYGRELYYHKRYEEALQIFYRFLEEGKGWIENNIDACCHCAYCEYFIGGEDTALRWLFRTFTYDSPRAEVCCDVARHFFDRNRYEQAIYWYAAALACKRNDERGGFVSVDCYGYLPCIQLCVCYAKLGNVEKAEIFNEMAAKFTSESEAVMSNREYFQALKIENHH